MPGTHGFIQTKLDHWSINMNKNFNCNDYIYIYNCYRSSQQIFLFLKTQNAKVRLYVIKFIY